MTRTSKYAVHAVIEGMGIETSVPVINPGNHNWGKKVYLIDVGVGYSSYPFLVEASRDSDAIEEFSDSPEGHRIHADAPAMSDDDSIELGYYYDDSGRACELDNMALRDIEVSRVRYFAAHLPKAGCAVADYTDDGKDAFKKCAVEWCKQYDNNDTVHAMAGDVVALSTVTGRYRRVAEEAERIEEMETACHALADKLIDEGKEDELSDVIKGLRLIAEDE